MSSWWCCLDRQMIYNPPRDTGVGIAEMIRRSSLHPVVPFSLPLALTFILLLPFSRSTLPHLHPHWNPSVLREISQALQRGHHKSCCLLPSFHRSFIVNHKHRHCPNQVSKGENKVRTSFLQRFPELHTHIFQHL